MSIEHDSAGPAIDEAAEYDALADLFLDDERHDPIPFPQEPPSPLLATERVIEGLIVGHLPVLASAWVSQYARHRNRELGCPIALMRLRAGRASIDLFGVDDADSADSFEDAVRLADQVDAAWILRVDEPDEPRLADADIDDLTLLTGADQAAIVASYRVIKRLAGEVEPEDGPAHVRLAAMGSDERGAATIGEKVKRAATTFLGCEIEVAGVVSRIEPGRACTIFDAPMDLSVDRVVDAIRAVAIAPARDEDIIVGASVDEPAPAEQPEPLAAPAHPTTTLASHVNGLHALPTTCPYAEGVELARDDAGRLHLLSSAAPSGVAGLLSAKQWATMHAALLAAAHGPLDAREAVCHLMTDDAGSARSMLDTDLRVHLLAQVEVEGRRGWYCTPLN